MMSTEELTHTTSRTVFQLAVTAISMPMMRATEMMNKALNAQAQLKTDMECEELDAISTLCTAMAVDAIGDHGWIQAWEDALAPDDDTMIGRLCLEAKDVLECAGMTIAKCIAQIEWFHTMQHATEKGEEPDWSKLAMEGSVDEALEKGDPEEALMIAVSNWLANRDDNDTPPIMDVSEFNPFEEVLEDIENHLAPSLMERAQYNIEVLKRVEAKELNEKDAGKELQEGAKKHDEKLDRLRKHRGNDAAKVLDEYAEKRDPIKRVVGRLLKQFEKSSAHAIEVKPDGEMKKKPFEG